MARQKGFTLIELMVAIALAALLLSMAVPALDSFTTNARVTVCASSDGVACEAVPWNQGWIVFSDQNSNQLIDGTDAIVTSSGEVDGLAVQSGEFGLAMQYRPNGRVTNAGANGNSGQFTVCDDRGADYAKVVIVDLSGRPRLSKTMADGSDPDCI